MLGILSSWDGDRVRRFQSQPETWVGWLTCFRRVPNEDAMELTTNITARSARPLLKVKSFIARVVCEGLKSFVVAVII